MTTNFKTVYIMRGIPGSGKSTKAKSLAPAENIFSTDEYWMVDGEYQFDFNRLGLAHRWNEDRAADAMSRGVTPIVIDNTNVKVKAFQAYLDMAAKYKYTVEIVMPDTPWWNDIYPRIQDKTFTDDDINLLTSKTVHGVPFDSIKGMMKGWEKYNVVPRSMNIQGNAIIADIDGTLALMAGRSPYDLSRVHEDDVSIAVRNVVKAFHAIGYSILIVSGREGTDQCRALTEQWLAKHEIPYHNLWMRTAKDMRNDAIVKQEIYDAVIKDHYEVEFVLDDRDRVVEFWRSIGLKCFQVEPGNF
jgi:hypothetical protein